MNDFSDSRWSKVMNLVLAVGAGLVTATVLLFFATRAQAGDIEWSGLYRVEGVQLHHPALDSGTGVGRNKDYGIHTLILRPKIVAADGLYITSQLNVFNSNDPTLGNQFGQYFGSGLGDGTPTSVNDSNATSESQESSDIKVTQFYLTHVQEYGSLIVGRAPLQFGLGVTHNAGRGLFDHYSDTRDLVGYKISMGNFYFLPMYAKISEGNISGHDDVSEVNFQLQYENPETDSSMGLFYQNRTSSKEGNDAPQTAYDSGALGVSDDFGAKNFNVFFKKETPIYNVGFEIAQQDGKTGIKNSDGKEIEMSGFALAVEYEYHAPESKNAFGLKTGYVTGDDPDTLNDYEGFIFDRNYDLAMLMFNHGLGQADFLHTKLIGRTDTPAAPHGATVAGKPDVEAISNVTYLSIYMQRKWHDKWSMVTTATTGWLNDTTMGAGGGTAAADLGYELDLSFVFKATDKITWINQLGYLIPGSAWEGDDQFDAKNMYGLTTKAAVSF